MDADELYKKAYGAVERGNPDYAIELFMQILDFFPDHVQARKSLRATELRRAEEDGLSSLKRALIFFKAIDVAMKIVFLKMGKKHEKAMSECERYLMSDPKAVWVLQTLGECSKEANHLGAAQVAYENILMADRDNSAALGALADLCEAREEFEQAHKYLARLKVLKPNDRNVEKRIRDIAAQSTMTSGQWDKTDSDFRDKLKDKKDSERLESAQHTIRTDEDVDKAIDRLEADLEKNPSDNRLLRELGDMYRRRRAFAKAFDAYSRCLQNDANDFLAKSKIGDMKIQQFADKIEKLGTGLAEGKRSDDDKGQLDKLKKGRLDFSVQEFRRRSKDMPTDTAIKFQLGRLLRETGVYDEAISNFQASVADSKHKIESHIELGLCFKEKNQPDMAERQLMLANDAVPNLNRQKKEILYQLAIVQIIGGKPGEALNNLTKIYEIDINFKDVAKQLESLKAAK